MLFLKSYTVQCTVHVHILFSKPASVLLQRISKCVSLTCIRFSLPGCFVSFRPSILPFPACLSVNLATNVFCPVSVPSCLILLLFKCYLSVCLPACYPTCCFATRLACYMFARLQLQPSLPVFMTPGLQLQHFLFACLQSLALPIATLACRLALLPQSGCLHALYSLIFFLPVNKLHSYLTCFPFCLHAS
jgi:hypothetical protein